MEGAPSIFMLGLEAWVLYPCTDTPKEGKGGKGNGVCEENVSRPDLSVFLRREVRSAPWLGSRSQWNRVLSVVEFLCCKLGPF